MLCLFEHVMVFRTCYVFLNMLCLFEHVMFIWTFITLFYYTSLNLKYPRFDVFWIKNITVMKLPWESAKTQNMTKMQDRTLRGDMTAALLSKLKTQMKKYVIGCLIKENKFSLYIGRIFTYFKLLINKIFYENSNMSGISIEWY